MRALRTRVSLLLVVAVGGCTGGEAGRPEALEKREGAIAGCAAKSVTTVATVAYDYDLAGRQTRDRDARLLYDPWNQLKEVQLITTTSPKYNDGRTVVAEKHTYGFDGIRTSTTTNPGAANAAVRVQITPDDLIHDSKREHYVRVGDRIVARLAMTASGTLALNDPPNARPGGDGRPLGVQRPSPPASALPPPWPVVGLAALILGAAGLLNWRRRRRWAPSFVGVALLAASCQMFGEGVAGNSSTLLLAEKVYFHTSLGAGPSLITRQDGTILEERRFEPFGVPINAFRSGRAGTAAVDLVTDPQSIVGKQADATNTFTDHGARWLSSQSARWLTPDPATRVPDKKFLNAPWDLHPYTYAKGNPTALWDPDGRCAAPVGLKPGEVGVCFEAFIGTKWVPGRIPGGRGDERTFAADDASATSRFQIRLRIDPTAKFPVVKEDVYDHVSGVIFKDHGPKGEVSVQREVSKDPQGNVDLKYDVSALNGAKNKLGYFFRFLSPRELDDPIDMKLNLRSSLGGKLSITPGGGIDAYPSYGVYGYRVQPDGSVKSFPLFEFKETTIDKLQDPLDVEIPSTKPQ